MIDINATLVLQAVHFGVAYVLLKYLLFDPALHFIYAQERHMHDAVSRLQSLRRAVEHAEQDKESLWAQAQSYFARHTPSPDARRAKPTSEYQLEAPMISLQERANAQKELEKAFVKSWDTDAI